MAPYLSLPNTADFNIGNQRITLQAFNTNDAKQHLNQQPVNIIASGPSVSELCFSKLLATPTIFVNGSISLTAVHDFQNIVGYVISDANFIRHQPEILRDHYTGQPLYATLAVFEAMAKSHPDLMHTYHKSMRILYPVDRPWGVKANKLVFDKLVFRKKTLNKSKPLSYFATHPSFVIADSQAYSNIGVSLDISDGFVEAGTVAYVATQLAFSRYASSIHLYGIDLLNSRQPRFYEESHNSAPTKLDTVLKDLIVPSFNLLSKAYKAHGVMVINHSPISKTLF